MRRTTNRILALAIGVISLAALVNACGPTGSKSLKIGVAQYLDHPALDATRQGFMDELKRLGYGSTISAQIDYFSANGDINTAQSIADRYVNGGYNLIFALATPMAQATKRAASGKSVPIVFGAITDPVSSGLVQAMDKPGDGITGTSDQWPYEDQLRLLKEVMPNIKNICVVSNPGEDNSRYAMIQTRTAASKLSLTLVEAPVSNQTDIFEAAESIARKCEAFYVPADNTVMAGAPAVVKVANNHRLPVLAGDPGTFKAGCFIGLGVSYYDLGVQSAQLADQILRGGKKAGDLAVVVSKNPEIMVNLDVAKRLGIQIPESVLARAKEKVGSGSTSASQ